MRTNVLGANIATLFFVLSPNQCITGFAFLEQQNERPVFHRNSPINFCDCQDSRLSLSSQKRGKTRLSFLLFLAFAGDPGSAVDVANVSGV